MDSHVRIAPLAEEDIVPCGELMATSEPWTQYGITLDDAIVLWRRALAEGATVSVAHLEARATGFAWYIAGGGFGLSGYLKLLGVTADTRGCGIGSALLDHVERRTL